MNPYIKNIVHQKPLAISEEVSYQPGQIVSKTLAQNQYHSLTLFAFDKGEEISTHAAGGDAMVTVLEGKGRFTVADKVFYLEAGENIFIADNTVIYRQIRVDIELYTALKDPQMEKTVEDALSTAELIWIKDEDYLDSERCYMITYTVAI